MACRGLSPSWRHEGISGAVRRPGPHRGVVATLPLGEEAEQRPGLVFDEASRFPKRSADIDLESPATRACPHPAPTPRGTQRTKHELACAVVSTWLSSEGEGRAARRRQQVHEPEPHPDGRRAHARSWNHPPSGRRRSLAALSGARWSSPSGSRCMAFGYAMDEPLFTSRGAVK